MVTDRQKHLERALEKAHLTGEDFTKLAFEGLKLVFQKHRNTYKIPGESASYPDDQGVIVNPSLSIAPRDCVINIEILIPEQGLIDWHNLRLEAELLCEKVLRQTKAWDVFPLSNGEEYASGCIGLESWNELRPLLRGECKAIRRQAS